MRLRHLIGTIFLLSSIICSCSKITPDSQYTVKTDAGYVNVKHKDFGFLETKASTKAFSWQRGDQICVYSLVDGMITYKDTVTITQPNGNTCKVRALVDVESTQYFATYPMNAIKCEVGERLDDEALRVLYNGAYRGVSIMTCYAPTDATDLYFEQRLSLLEIRNLLGRVNGNVIIESSLPVDHSFSMGSGGTYYIPISHKSETVKITFKTDNIKRTKEMNVSPGHIYTSEFTIN